MKTFDYTKSRVTQFNIILGDTIGIFRKLQLIDDPLTVIVQQRASIGYFVVMTIDARGHLEPRDMVKLLGRGTAKLVFPPGANVEFRYWSDLDLTDWYSQDYTKWHRVTGATRKP